MRNVIITISVIIISEMCLALPVSAVTQEQRPYCSVYIETDTWLCSQTAGELEPARAATYAPSTQYLIARLYDNHNYDTAAGYLNVYASGDCTPSGTGVDFSIADLGTWSLRISSFKVFGNCAARLWSSTGFAGAVYPSATGLLGSSAYVGVTFNDKARSAQFS